jgi:leader peptidase (prepilin peptidase)/N-methyltransferase
VAEASGSIASAKALLRWARLWRCVLLAVTVTPLLRWAVVVHAVPAGQPWRRECLHCETSLGLGNWWPLTPAGRCGRCRQRLGAPPWTVEGAAVAAALLLANAQLPGWAVPAYSWWAAIGVVLAFVDIAVHRLPNRLTWAASGGFLMLAGLAAWHGYAGAWVRAAGAAVVLGCVLAVCVLAWPRSVGLGDVKYALAVGAAAGWVSWFAVYAAVFAATFLGALVSIGLLATRRASRRSYVAMGPFLFAGALLAVFLLP